MGFQESYQQKLTTLQDAVASIEDNTLVHIGAAGTVCANFATELFSQYQRFDNLDVMTALSLRPYAIGPELKHHITLHTYFAGALERAAVRKQLSTFASIDFSTLDIYFNETVKCDVLVIDSPPMDEDGYFNGSITFTASHELLFNHPRVIIQVNEAIPYIYGEKNRVHVDDVDMIYEHNEAPGILTYPPVTELEQQIANHIVDLVPDGATLQVGVGGTANATIYSLRDKKDLGIHTEMMTDSLADLVEEGVFTGKYHPLYPGKLLTSMALGSQKLYDLMDHNEQFWGLSLPDLAAPATVAKIDNFISINNAMAVDLTGQVASEGLGYDAYSGTGGSSPFVRGARRSKGGKSIICVPSTIQLNGAKESRIVLDHKAGTPINVQRADTMYIATEYGVVNLWGKSTFERAQLLISIAHPDFRDQLTEEATAAGLIY